MRIERLNETTKKTLLEDLLKRSPNQYGAYEADVKKILDEVKEKKDEAVFAYTKQFDKADIDASNIRVTEAEIAEAYELVDGSIELAPIVGLSEVIVDIVETGSTLKENGLVVLEEVCPLSARMIVNPVSMRMENERIKELITNLRNLVQEESHAD